MKTSITSAVIPLILLAALTCWAGPIVEMHEGGYDVRIGGAGTAQVDTLVLMGPGGDYQGDLEDAKKAISLPDEWNSVDVTQIPSHWVISDHNNTQPGMSGLTAWCGEDIAACLPGPDDPWGYGNKWRDWLECVYEVPDPMLSSTVNLTYNIYWDTEPSYDYVNLYKVTVDESEPMTLLATYDGEGSQVGASVTTTYDMTEYYDGNAIIMRFEFVSDVGWSDEDCKWPTSGAVNLDDIFVEILDGSTPIFTQFTDFDTKIDGFWNSLAPPAVGDFAKIWDKLEDFDPCPSTNHTKVLAFLDDGSVTGNAAYPCLTWCYGQNNYVVHPEGGAAGPDYHLENYVETPVMTWPDQSCDGILFSFDNYTHETIFGDSPGIFTYWGVRSANGQQILDTQNYLDRNLVYYGTPAWERREFEVSDLMEPGRMQVQFRIGVIELGHVWGIEGLDPDPAPYFDNLNVKVYPKTGPAMAAREIELAQDNFFEVGSFDPANLPRHHVRFDMAQNIAPSGSGQNIPGDWILVDIAPLRAGAVLVETPTLHFSLNKNPVFTDAMRTSGLGIGFPGPVSGSVPGWATDSSTSTGQALFAFDLPDTGFLFPGDVMHYYIEASEDLNGDITTATLPADLTGFGDFSHPLTYDSSFVVHALPSVRSDGMGGYTQPQILFWDDFGNPDAEAKWYNAMDRLDKIYGYDVDIFRTNGPSSGVGNGLGGRIGRLGLVDYDIILHSSGDLCHHTLANGNPLQDPGDDLQVLMDWLDLGDKYLLTGGDNLASELAEPGNTKGNQFLSSYMGVQFVAHSVRPLIGNPSNPKIWDDPIEPTIIYAFPWMAYGGCPDRNMVDAVLPVGGAKAAFFDDGSEEDNFPYSACTSHTFGNPASTVVSFPYAWDNVIDLFKDAAPMPARTRILAGILEYFGDTVVPREVTQTPQAVRFDTRNFPNPFNPVTEIEYTVPRAGMLTLKIYNVRGELVRTLIDDVVQTSGSIQWDGTADSGATVSSGIYFSEARFGNEVSIQKMALVK